MMMHAYPEIYLSSAMSNMGDLFSCAIDDCGFSDEEFIPLFTSSTVCKRIERGEASCLVGQSGCELLLEICEESGTPRPKVENIQNFNRTPAYWCGMASCYYQWESGRNYEEIFRILAYADFMELFPTLHEADITKFADIADQRFRTLHPETKLKQFRTAYGCSQSQLAKLAGVSLRSIQMYEQRNKDINKAGAETLLRLSKTLGCEIEDLLER